MRKSWWGEGEHLSCVKMLMLCLPACLPACLLCLDDGWQMTQMTHGRSRRVKAEQSKKKRAFVRHKWDSDKAGQKPEDICVCVCGLEFVYYVVGQYTYTCARHLIVGAAAIQALFGCLFISKDCFHGLSRVAFIMMSVHTMLFLSCSALDTDLSCPICSYEKYWLTTQKGVVMGRREKTGAKERAKKKTIPPLGEWGLVS